LCFCQVEVQILPAVAADMPTEPATATDELSATVMHVIRAHLLGFLGYVASM